MKAEIATQPWSEKMSESMMELYPRMMNEWSYEDGVVFSGMIQVYLKTGDEKYLRYVQAEIDRFVDAEGHIAGYDPAEYNIDHVNSGKIILFLYEHTKQDKYRKAAERIRGQLRNHPRTSEGGLWHKQIYPYQMWLDGLYMGAPFYAQYASIFQETEAFDDITNQFILIEKHLKNAETGLYYHAWDERKQQQWASPVTGCSPHYWGRAMGWFAMAIVDVLDFLPEGHKDRQKLIGMLDRMLHALANVQDPASGVWWQVLDRPGAKGNYPEASASCMIVYAAAKAIRKGYIGNHHLNLARRGFDGILNTFVHVDPEGIVLLTLNCAVAGLGRYIPDMRYRNGSYEYYVSEPIVTNDKKGVGAFIQACAEMERLSV